MIPKFRAWDKQNKKMCSVKGWHEFNGGEVTIKRQQEFASYQVPADSVILMQSTGLFDKNGQEIFEKDVVKRISLSPGGIDCVGIVKMLEGAWVIDTGNAAVSLWTEIDENEVIGNVYENPDLLEVADE